jgi:small subunit ribosomal protein S6
MIGHYEQVFVINPTLDKEDIDKIVESLKENIVKNGGELLCFQEMGMRKLAYRIDDYKRGYYGVFYFKIEPSAIYELERVMRYNEDILRYITVKHSTKRDIKWFNKMIEDACGKKDGN